MLHVKLHLIKYNCTQILSAQAAGLGHELYQAWRAKKCRLSGPQSCPASSQAVLPLTFFVLFFSHLNYTDGS